MLEVSFDFDLVYVRLLLKINTLQLVVSIFIDESARHSLIAAHYQLVCGPLLQDNHRPFQSLPRSLQCKTLESHLSTFQKRRSSFKSKFREIAKAPASLERSSYLNLFAKVQNQHESNVLIHQRLQQ